MLPNDVFCTGKEFEEKCLREEGGKLPTSGSDSYKENLYQFAKEVMNLVYTPTDPVLLRTDAVRCIVNLVASKYPSFLYAFKSDGAIIEYSYLVFKDEFLDKMHGSVAREREIWKELLSQCARSVVNIVKH